MAYRSSTGNLGAYEESNLRPQRWDRDRFERARSRGAPDERIRIDEIDRHSASGRTRHETDIEIDINRNRGPEPERERERLPPRRRFEERDRFYEEDRYAPPPRRNRPEFLEEPIPPEVANRALAPYRRKSIHEREREIEARPPPRPGLLRRQSSLDTFDRRPLPRFEREREELVPHPGRGVPVPAPISPWRQKYEYDGSRGRFREDDYEEIEYRDYDPKWREEDYRDIRIRRERSRIRRPARSVVSSKRSSSSSSFEEVSRASSPPKSEAPKVGKRGRTKMPKRLVRKEALHDLEYPFEEEEDFLIVKRALGKEQIDEIIKITEKYKEPQITTYKFEEPAPAPPPPPPSVPQEITEVIERKEIIEEMPPGSHHSHSHVSVHEPIPPAPPSSHHTHTHLSVHEVPPPSSHHSPSHLSVREVSPPESAHSHRSHRTHRSSRSRSHSAHHTHIVRSVSPPRREIVEERVEEFEGVGGPLTTVILPERHRRSERDIRTEIRRLEAEKRALRLERDADIRLIEADRVRDREYEIVEPREVIRVEKDRKEKRPPPPKLVAAMMATLT
ncbi:MAG: hypothetical protein M1820_002790 [Bogoriella megaspora]|nr:MAG: hypothetical protein M1820_002790 [Bogoriella megaspora]